jgi:O-antigen/teichoic acid export membrane protein
MIKFLIGIFKNKLGIDKSIFWGVLNKAFGFIKGPLNIIFLFKYLTPDDQGLWYTFGSLGALTVFAELGFTSIMTQFVSHEYARLDENDRKISSHSLEIDRLLGIIKYSIKFYFIVIPAAIFILAIVGYYYFRVESIDVYFAWFIFSIVGGLGLFLGLLQSLYQGLDKVKEVQINIFLSAAINTILTWIMLILHFKIWALVLGNLTGIIISSFLLFRIDPKFWNLVIKYHPQKKYNFFKETMPLQGRYAITWISSYFISYLYVPATYKMVGEAMAGQLGVTITILTAISGIANNWVQTKVPKFNILVSLRDNNSLNSLFRRSTIQGLLVLLFLLLLFVFGLFILKLFVPMFSDRFLSINLTLLLLIPQVVQYLIGAYATYLRAHKEEPYMWLSVLTAIFLIGAVFGVLSQNLGLKVLFYALNFIYLLIIFPMAVKIYNNKKVYYLFKFNKEY